MSGLTWVTNTEAIGAGLDCARHKVETHRLSALEMAPARNRRNESGTLIAALSYPFRRLGRNVPIIYPVTPSQQTRTQLTNQIVNGTLRLTSAQQQSRTW